MGQPAGRADHAFEHGSQPGTRYGQPDRTFREGFVFDQTISSGQDDDTSPCLS